MNCPLVCNGIISGYIFLLIIDANPDWKVLPMPGLVVRPTRLNLRIAIVPGVYDVTLKNL